MKTKRFSDAMNEIEDHYLCEALEYRKKGKRGWVLWVSVAACSALVVVGVCSMFFRDEIVINVVDFSQVTLDSLSTDLVVLTEEELFNSFYTEIFKGTVCSIENIEISFNGSLTYCSLVTISVEKVYRGDLLTDETITLLAPIPIDAEGLLVTGTEVISDIRVDMTGVFMLYQFTDDNSMWTYNDVSLDKRDLAQYGIFDSERYLFLETEEGLSFARWAYESIASAQTLDDVEEYILDMLA